MIVSCWLSDENDACKNDIYPYSHLDRPFPHLFFLYLCIRNRMNDNSNQNITIV